MYVVLTQKRKKEKMVQKHCEHVGIQKPITDLTQSVLVKKIMSKLIFNRKKENLQKKKKKKISTNVLIVSAVPPQVYNIIK